MQLIEIDIVFVFLAQIYSTEADLPNTLHLKNVKYRHSMGQRISERRLDFSQRSTVITADVVVALNSGAYRHCITAFPTVNLPGFCTLTSYSTA